MHAQSRRNDKGQADMRGPYLEVKFTSEKPYSIIWLAISHASTKSLLTPGRVSSDKVPTGLQGRASLAEESREACLVCLG